MAVMENAESIFARRTSPIRLSWKLLETFLTFPIYNFSDKKIRAPSFFLEYKSILPFNCRFLILSRSLAYYRRNSATSTIFFSLLVRKRVTILSQSSAFFTNPKKKSLSLSPLSSGRLSPPYPSLLTVFFISFI